MSEVVVEDIGGEQVDNLIMERLYGDDEPKTEEEGTVEPEPEVQEENEAEVEVEDVPVEEEAEEVEEEPTEELEEEAEAEEEPEEEVEDDAVYKFELPDGSEVEASMNELKRGFLRQNDYTQKTMKLAEERKVALHEKEQLHAVQNIYLQRLETVIPELEATTNAYANIDWAAEFRTNPAEAGAAKIEYDKQQQQLQAAQQEREHINAYQAQLQQENFQKSAQEQKAILLERNPELVDEQKFNAFYSRIHSYGIESGYSEEQLNYLVDATTLSMMDKARKYDALQASKPMIKKKAAKVPKVTARGTAKNQSDVRSHRKQQELKRTQADPSDENITEYLMNHVL